jgi:hypothetical protein
VVYFLQGSYLKPLPRRLAGIEEVDPEEKLGQYLNRRR